MIMRTILPCAALALAACSGGEPAVETPTPTGSGAVAEVEPAVAPQGAGARLYVLNCGDISVSDMGVFDSGGAYDGQAREVIDTCFLVRHPKGDFLWDTGIPDAVHDIVGGVVDGVFTVTMPKTLAAQLAEIGLAPADIEYVSISHSHFDHVGNAGQYASATFIVNEAERAHMFRDEARADAQTFAGYSALETAKTETFTDEYDVFGDGSVRIISAPGHTPGHSVLLLQLDKTGPVLLSGDLYHLTPARLNRTVPSFNTDAEATLRSMDKFEAIAAETGARVIIQHERADYLELPHAPDFLD